MQIEQPVVISVAGSDSGGGAGIQADLKTFAANGAFGTTAITCLTAQNPNGVRSLRPLDPEFVMDQLEQVADAFTLGAIKTGMLLNESIIRTVAEFCRRYPEVPKVIDPVMVATSGAILLEPEAIDAFQEELLPLATCITPNLDEAAVLLEKESIDRADMEVAGQNLAEKFKTTVLLKGGHLAGSEIVDLIAFPNGEFHSCFSERIPDVNTHGSGCTLSSAIAAQLALGHQLIPAIEQAIAYVQKGMRQPCVLDGTSYICH